MELRGSILTTVKIGTIAMQLIRDLLTTAEQELFKLRSDDQLVKAAKLLSGATRHMVVICDEDEKMAGIVTRADIVRRMGHCEGGSCLTSCADVMTKDVQYCKADDALDSVWNRMRSGPIQCMPIVGEHHAPIGLLSARLVLEELMKKTEHQDKLLIEYVMGIGYR